MSYTITKAKSDLQGILHGTSVNKVTNILSVFNRAARQVLEDVDPQETKRKAQITTALFDQVYDYTAPSDLKGNKVIDIRPQINRTSADVFSQNYSANFDIFKTTDDGLLQIEFNEGIKTLRAKKDLTGFILVNDADSLTGNGTWAGTNDATSLTTDTLTHVSGSGSVKFNVSGATTTATLTNSTFTAVDLSGHEDEATEFFWLFIPSGTVITSVNLKWGSSSGNTWDRTVTAAFSGAFQTGWNQLGFAWNGATETGTPVSTAVDFLQVTIVYDGDVHTALRIDGFSSNLGQIFDIVYYSKFLFEDGTSGTWKEEASDDADLLNLDTESFNLFLFKSAEFASQQIEQLKDDTGYFANQYKMALNKYKGMYKSEIIRPQNTYYRM